MEFARPARGENRLPASADDSCRRIRYDDGIYATKLLDLPVRWRRRGARHRPPLLALRPRRPGIRRAVSRRDPAHQCHRIIHHRALCHAHRPGRALARRPAAAPVLHDRHLRRLHHIFLLQPANSQSGARWPMGLCCPERRPLVAPLPGRRLARLPGRRNLESQPLP